MLTNSINEILKDICRNLLAVQKASVEFQHNLVIPDTIVRLDLLKQFDASLSQLLTMFNAGQLESEKQEVPLSVFQLLSDALADVRRGKQEIVESEVYEHAALFREIEKHIEVLISYWRIFSHFN